MILRLRKTQKDIFIYGNFELLDVENDDVFAYKRSFEKETVIVVANFRKTPVDWVLPKNTKLQEENMLISNHPAIKAKEGAVSLRPFEAFACFVD